MNVLELKVPPPVVAAVIAAAMWKLATLTPLFLLPLPGHSVIAFVIAAAGALIELAGALSFVRVRTSVDPIHPNSASTLVVVGVYRFTRNPMYLGDLLILVGWGVYLSHLLALLLVPLFVLYINRFQISAEERILSAKFGAQYTAYQARVRRWI